MGVLGAAGERSIVALADGILVLESIATVPLPGSPLWELVREKNYGTTRVSYLKPRQSVPA